MGPGASFPGSQEGSKGLPRHIPCHGRPGSNFTLSFPLGLHLGGHPTVLLLS